MAKFLGSTEGRFFVPTACRSQRRAQPRSRLAVAARAPQAPLLPGHALTAASPARGLRVGALGRDMGGETWSWTGPWMTNAATPHHLVYGPGQPPGTL